MALEKSHLKGHHKEAGIWIVKYSIQFKHFNSVNGTGNMGIWKEQSGCNICLHLLFLSNSQLNLWQLEHQ